ncbi:modulator of Hok protein [Escherichia coli]|nr:modulator of Hok protein [Escherichia coli]
MLRQHQDSLLPRFAQGEEGHETTTQLSCLVCVDRVSHTVDIHLSDTKIAVRDSLQRRIQGGGGFHGLRVRQEVVQHIVLINHLYKTNYSISCSLLRQARLVTALSEALGTM